MFDNTVGTLKDVPVAIQGYYKEDVRSEPTGNIIQQEYKYNDENGEEQTGYRDVAEMHDVTYIVLKSLGETQSNVSTVMKLGKPKSIIDQFVGFDNNAIDKQYHSDFLDWLKAEPLQDDDEFYVYENIEIDDTKIYSQDLFNEAHQSWQGIEPVKQAYKVIDDYPESKHWRKRLGVEFEGVMCSALKDDQFGIGSLHQAIKAGSEFNFEFENGNTLKLTPSNIDDFMNVWGPFRNSFF